MQITSRACQNKGNLVLRTRELWDCILQFVDGDLELLQEFRKADLVPL